MNTFKQQLLIITITIITISLLINTSVSYTLSTEPTCNDSNRQYSPISISSSNSKFYEEKVFRILGNNYTYFNHTLKTFPNDNAIGYDKEELNDLGTVLIVKDWSLYRFNLTKVLIRARSSHQIDNNFNDAEIQLVHDLDTTYLTPGRYIAPTANKLVITLPFKVTSNNTYGAYSQFFNYTNIATYKDNTTSSVYPINEIKLRQMVNHGVSYLYEGGLDVANCENAWNIVLVQYHEITATDLSNIKAALTNAGYISTAADNGNNTRDIQPVRTTIYRSELLESGMAVEKNRYLSYVSTKMIDYSIYVIFVVVCGIIFA